MSAATPSVQEVKKTTCYMCACRCGIRVHLVDGQVRYIDGNPDHPLNQGVICAKGSSGIMKQYSPARLTQPLLRKPGSERGAGEFEPISWEQAFTILSERLAKIRATDPKRFALFTGRDQMQALTGLFARQFGTPNYAAHGGFCSVNMAAGMIYTIGGSFWEFGGPDLDRAKLFVMIGTAEDHHSNPMKIALSKFKRNGGRFVSINPVRTGYSAIADEWVPIRPGTDGALLLAIIHEIIASGPLRPRLPGALHQRRPAGEPRRGPERRVRHVPAHRGAATKKAVSIRENKLWWDPRFIGKPVGTHTPGCRAASCSASYQLEDGTPVKPCLPTVAGAGEAEYTPEWAAGITGIPTATIKPPGPRDGRHRPRPADRAAHPLD
jgi:anaerobic selenocysteine-containing dehydrogenase